MANMPSTNSYHLQGDYLYNTAEVPGGEFDIGFINSLAFEPEWTDQYHPLKPQDSIPVPKSEPYLPEYLETSTCLTDLNWPYQHHVMASPYQQTTPPNQQLQLSDPPTPAAECQVTSTKLSPFPNSPYSPHNSEVSYEGQDPNFEMLQEDLGEINIKGLTEEQLVSLSARDLNRLCRDMPEDIVKQLKKRRRTLKNRGYAYNSRVRRVSQKATLEEERDALKKQLLQITERCKLLERESEQWKRRAQALERGEI